MTIQEILEKVEKFFESEYEETKTFLERNLFEYLMKKEVVSNSIQRCLGVTQFIQCLDIPYESLDIYDIYRKKLESLLDK